MPITIIQVNERYVSHLPTLSHALRFLANDASCKNSSSKSISVSIYLHFDPRCARLSSYQKRLDLSLLILNCIPTAAKVIRRPVRIFISASEIRNIPAVGISQYFNIGSELSRLIEEGVFVLCKTERRESWQFDY
jgi:hypothetical protein